MQTTMARPRDVGSVAVGAVRACAVGVGAISATAARVGTVRAMDAVAHLPLCVHPAAGAVGQWLQRVGLAGEGAAPVAVDAGGGQVDRAPKRWGRPGREVVRARWPRARASACSQPRVSRSVTSPSRLAGGAACRM